MLLTGTERELTVEFSNLEYFLLKKPGDCIPPDLHLREHDDALNVLSFNFFMN